MPEATLSPLLEAITEQLKPLSAEDLHTIQEFVDYLAWKRQQRVSPIYDSLFCEDMICVF
ncbi:MAG: hypothetical protein IGR92_10195 [Leptolyngbyaceae cyanobacterium T60_A2020_046]|nr:hypothetical protein [Leptolyngbyaceae cyanobacterium T60_A2020_046]